MALRLSEFSRSQFTQAPPNTASSQFAFPLTEGSSSLPLGSIHSNSSHWQPGSHSMSLSESQFNLGAKAANNPWNSIPHSIHDNRLRELDSTHRFSFINQGYNSQEQSTNAAIRSVLSLASMQENGPPKIP